MKEYYDIGIIGAGVAGAFAALKIAKDYKNIKTIVFDLGRPPMKRRRQLEGWLGLLPNSDGKLYQSDIKKISNLVGVRKAKSANSYVNNIINQIDDFKIIKDKYPFTNMSKKIKKQGFDLELNDYIQIYPKEIHILSKHMANIIELNKNVYFCFDDEVFKITKQKNVFVINTEMHEYRCKKIIMAVGRSGWRWANEIYNHFGIIENNDIARFGIRVETNSSIMKDFNKSNCTLKKEGLEIGPLNWYGTVIPEDHLDMAISSFRSNENRWETDKVSFSIIGEREFINNGFEQTNRIGQLTFILSNERIIKEKVSNILHNKSRISIMKEYDWLKETIADLSFIIPEIATKSYFHIPTIVPMTGKINIGSNLSTDIEGMFVAGESAGITGLLSAACTGIIAAEQIVK